MFLKKKIKEKENVYYDLEGNEVYDANTRTFIMNIPEDVRPLILECIDKRVSIKGIANTRLDYNTTLMLINEGIQNGISDLEVWKIANSRFSPEIMELAIRAAKRNVFLTSIEFVPKIDRRVLLLLCRAAEQGLDMSDKVTPLSTVESFKRSIWLRLLFQGRPGLFKKIDMQFETKENTIARIVASQQD